MSDYTPTDAEVRHEYVMSFLVEYQQDASDEFDRWLAEHDAKVRAETLREFATWLDGGTPRAWGFHHPCDPPDTRWEPNAEDRGVMRTADYAREVADRIEKETGL